MGGADERTHGAGAVRPHRPVAVVTGGAGLYGGPIAPALAEVGAHVVVAARDVAACEARRGGAGRQGGRVGPTARPGRRGVDRRALAGVVAEHGAIDVLVNNAVARAGGTIDVTSAADWRATSR